MMNSMAGVAFFDSTDAGLPSSNEMACVHGHDLHSLGHATFLSGPPDPRCERLSLARLG
jgi:hypothetical protein